MGKRRTMCKGKEFFEWNFLFPSFKRKEDDFKTSLTARQLKKEKQNSARPQKVGWIRPITMFSFFFRAAHTHGLPRFISLPKKKGNNQVADASNSGLLLTRQERSRQLVNQALSKGKISERICLRPHSVPPSFQIRKCGKKIRRIFSGRNLGFRAFGHLFSLFQGVRPSVPRRVFSQKCLSISALTACCGGGFQASKESKLRRSTETRFSPKIFFPKQPLTPGAASLTYNGTWEKKGFFSGDEFLHTDASQNVIHSNSDSGRKSHPRH